MDDERLEVLRDLAKFVQAFPPASAFQTGSRFDDERAVPLYLHPHQRLRIEFESTSDIGYGLWRSEELAEAGISCAELDAESFAKGLVARLADQLSIRNLEQLVAAFQTELDTMQARRSAAIARQKA